MPLTGKPLPARRDRRPSYTARRSDGSKWTVPSTGARRQRNRRRNAIAKQSRRNNRGR